MKTKQAKSIAIKSKPCKSTFQPQVLEEKIKTQKIDSPDDPSLTVANVSYKDLWDIGEYKKAYQEIKSKPGMMTPGVDGTTLDGISLEKITRVVNSIRSGEFQFKPSKRIYIEKANGKKRPIGIPCPMDKLVQRVFLNLLERVYEPVFLNSSHGFRPRRSCHTALREIKKWTGCTWLIEGDITGFFDNIDHHKLESLLLKKIKDKRLIFMYWKLVKAGYIESDNKVYKSSLGIPQGGTIFPLLSNIYLHELDMYIEHLKLEYDTGFTSKDNPVYFAERYKLKKLIQEGKDSFGNKVTKSFIEEEKKRVDKLTSKVRTGVRINYVRYADDFVIGVIGEHSVAVEIKEKVKVFLKKALLIDLNEEKTKITQLSRETGSFLGYNVFCTDRKYYESRLSPTRRSAFGRIKLFIPQFNIVNRLIDKGFAKRSAVDNSIRGKTFGPWVNQDDAAIIALYRSVILGYYNYYSLADNKYRLSALNYILKFSAAHTLACKHRSSIAQIFQKHGKDLRVKRDGSIEDKTAGVEKWIDLKIDLDKTPKINSSDSSTVKIEPFAALKYVMKTKFLIDETECKVCGSREQIEMHHVRALKDINPKLSAVNRLMIAMHRKQIPLCKSCHVKVHSGKHDGVKL